MTTIKVKPKNLFFTSTWWLVLFLLWHSITPKLLDIARLEKISIADVIEIIDLLGLAGIGIAARVSKGDIFTEDYLPGPNASDLIPTPKEKPPPNPSIE